MHTIRLSAAWEHPAGEGVSLRRFHTPTGLIEGDRVWLLLGGEGRLTELRLNAVELDATAVERRWEIAHLLRQGGINELHFASDAPKAVAAGALLQIEPAG